MSTLTERYQEAYAELQKVTAALNRIDERVDIFITKQTELERKVELHIEGCSVRTQFPKLYTQVALLQKTCNEDALKDIRENLHKFELELQATKKDLEQYTGSWRGTKHFFLTILVNLIWVIIAAFILYQIGLPSTLP